ncbi:signal peptidase I [Collinsella sp. An307]|uniref:signal peptidase I n=1 Tax=Collinsella sp. An307 TaxID=1965630 RepID=UPI00194FCDB8|nr:signal peptidase I [Collinsella sp. An307]
MAEYVVIESGSAAKAPTNSSEKISRPAPMEDAPSTANSMTPPHQLSESEFCSTSRAESANAQENSEAPRVDTSVVEEDNSGSVHQPDQQPHDPASEAQLQQRREHRRRLRQTVASTVGVLLCVAAAASLIAMYIAPVMRIDGSSMEPTLSDGQLVVTLRPAQPDTGDVVAFYLNNSILVKRVIARAGDWVDIDQRGNVSVNGQLLDEPYLAQSSRGTCDIPLPYQVPEGRIFVMGDDRATSLDSRTRAIGCIDLDQVIGVVSFRVWPLNTVSIV